MERMLWRMIEAEASLTSRCAQRMSRARALMRDAARALQKSGNV